MDEIYEVASCIFPPRLHALIMVASTPEIITCNSVLVPLAHAIISMLVLAPMFILLQARQIGRAHV